MKRISVPTRSGRNERICPATPSRHVLRIYRGRSYALIEQEWRDADDDTGLPESIGLTAYRGQQRQRLAGVIGDVDHGTRRPADQSRSQIGIDLIDGAALTGEDQFGTRLQ